MYRKVTSSPVSDLRLETKGSRFESGCYLCAKVSNRPANVLSVCEAGGSGSEELKKCSPPSPTILLFVDGCERKPI